ncbi:MAG: hypothetical protein AVDCRST_MAG56-4583 [uncultured Cytophagales bacterium]|uniref:Uncharacterized protein n=1 Tax=uncultured Cytophagales bacterium TaxID=158755 RepID=A0A6J4JYY4_9SPHI|nr:MAG: hypothetical protein AVDCRST_MAG56-4583 [uncultured Cytophagales bacterium]
MTARGGAGNPLDELGKLPVRNQAKTTFIFAFLRYGWRLPPGPKCRAPGLLRGF